MAIPPSAVPCVTFHYNRHEDDKYVEETIPVMEFIQRLIQHIPEKHYKMIRYGGLYVRHREIDKKLHRAISREKHSVYRSFNHKRVSLEEMYEKVMSRSRGKRSSS